MLKSLFQMQQLFSFFRYQSLYSMYIRENVRVCIHSFTFCGLMNFLVSSRHMKEKYQGSTQNLHGRGTAAYTRGVEWELGLSRRKSFKFCLTTLDAF